MIYTKYAALIIGLGAASIVAPTSAEARSSYGFSFSTGGPVFAPAPVYVAPPPPPIVYRPVYPVYPAPYYRPGPSFSFSYFGR